jgi:uncharacterized metal-binding protein YceD (DUF177 family)
MKRIEPEFHRPLEIARTPPSGSSENIAASAEECRALAKRFAVPAVLSLSAQLRVEHWRKNGAKVTGSLRAGIQQTCVVSLEDFVATVREPVERFYLPPGVSTGEADEDEADEIVDGVIDLGELVSETLALEIDPYPRKPGVEFSQDLTDAGEGEGSPFAILAKSNSKKP